jgi:hypothetical protein
MATLDRLNQLLTEVAKLLDNAASEIHNVHFAPERNIKRIGEALVSISEISLEIYQQRPDLAPKSLKK